MKYLKEPLFYIFFCGISAFFVAIAILALNVPRQPVVAMRAAASKNILEAGAGDLPSPIESREYGGRLWAVRRPVENGETVFKVIRAAEIIKDALYYANAQVMLGGTVFVPKTGGIIPNLANDRKSLPELSPLLALDGASMPQLYAPLPGHEIDALDSHGHPVRWRLPDNVLAGYAVIPPRRPVFRQENDGQRNLPDPAPNLTAQKSPSRYRELVERFARHYNLSVELVYAIIHSESDFSPTLVSNKSAMGLMQILPGTASGEVHRFLYGRKGQVSYDQLRIPEINIRYGTAYLHILFNRYFQNVSNPVSREYCAIAAYNLGPNRFLRLYGHTNEAAVERLNSFTPEALYNDLVSRLPARETRYYLAKVKKMKNYYTALLSEDEGMASP